MARIAGVNLPTNKRVVIALQYIHGIGPKIAQDIMGKVNLPAERRVSQLTDAEVLQIRFPFAASAPTPMRAPVKAPRRQLPGKRRPRDRVDKQDEAGAVTARRRERIENG